MPDVFDALDAAPASSGPRDIFDTLDAPSAAAAPKAKDVFDQISDAPAPKDVFDQISDAPAPSPALAQATAGDQRGIGSRLWDAVKAATPVGGTHGIAGSIVGAATGGLGIPFTGTGSSPAAGYNALFDKPQPPVESLYNLADSNSDADMRLLAAHAAQRYATLQAPADPQATLTDHWGNVVTPEGEAASQLAAKGWDNMSPAEKYAFRHLMQTGAAKQDQLAKGVPIGPEDVPGMGGTAAQQFAEGGLGTARMPLPSTEPDVRRAQQQLEQAGAKANPITAKVAGLVGAIADPLARAGAGAIGEGLAPVIGETPGVVAAVRSGSPGRVIGALQGAAIEGGAFGAASSTAQQVTQGHVDPDEIIREAAKQAGLQPAFHATVGAGIEGVRAAAGKPLEWERPDYGRAAPSAPAPSAPAPAPENSPEKPAEAPAPAPSAVPAPPADSHETLIGRLAAKYPDLKGNELSALAREMQTPSATPQQEQANEASVHPAAQTGDLADRAADAGAPQALAQGVGGVVRQDRTKAGDQPGNVEINQQIPKTPASPSPERAAQLEAAADRSLAAQKAQRNPSAANPGPKTAADMLLAAGRDDGLFPSDAERTGDTRGAIHPDATEALTRSQRQAMRGMVSEDRASDATAGMNAEQAAQYERSQVARFGATKADQLQQAIEHYKNHPDPHMRMLAVQAEAEGTGGKRTVSPATFSNGDRFTIGGRPFRVEVDADGNMTFHDDDVTIPHADALDEFKVDTKSIQRAPEADLSGDFAPAEAKPAESATPKTTGPQGSLLGERYEGSGNGSKTGSMFGDMRAGPASELEAKGNNIGQAEKDNETTPMFSGIPLPGIAAPKTDGTTDSAWQRFRDWVSLDTLPTLTRKAPDAANALVEHASAPIAARPAAERMAAEVLGDKKGNDEFSRKLANVIIEDNLRGIKQNFQDAGNTDAAGNVKTLIGDKFATEADYQAALKDPDIRAAIDRYKTAVNPELDAMYRRMNGMPEDAALESRGLDTGARMNLKAIVDPQDAGNVPGVGGSGNLRNPAVKRDRFSRQATGAGTYDDDLRSVLENVLSPRLNETTKLNAYDAMVKGGVAKWLEPGGKSTFGDGTRGKIIRVEVPGEGFNTRVSKNLLIRPEVYEEVRRALDTDLRAPTSPILRAVNSLQLLGVTDATVHARNLVSAVAQSQGTRSLITDIARKFPGVNIADALTRVGAKAAEISRGEIGTLKTVESMAKQGMLRADNPDGGHALPGAALLQKTDTATRLVLHDMYDNLVERGLAKDTPQDRRAFVNQAGQYNRRLQGKLMQTAKDIGIAPFVVAGRNFNRQAVRAITGHPGFGATSIQPRIVNLFTGLVATAAVAGGINYLTTGNMIGRDGVPVGAIDTGKNDDKGKPVYIDLAQWTQLRRGLRLTGIDAAVNGLLRGQGVKDTLSMAAADIISGQARPWFGPGAQTAFKVASTAASKEPADQKRAEIGQALHDVNPLLAAGTQELANEALGKETSPGTGFGSELARTGKSLAGVKSATPMGTQAEALARQLAGKGLDTTPPAPETREKNALKSQLVAKLRADGEAGAQAAEQAVKDGKLTDDEAKTLAKKAGMSPLSWDLRSLGAQDAAKVYDAATPAEKAQIGDAVRDKIVRSKLPADQQDKLLADHGITPPADLAADREYAGLEQKAQAGKDRTEQLARLARQLEAARAAGDGAKAEAIRQEGAALFSAPPTMNPQEQSRYKVLQEYRAARAQTQQRIKEGSMGTASGAARLAYLRNQLRKFSP